MNREMAMQTRNKIMDDISQLMTNAMGVAQGAKDEAETAMKFDPGTFHRGLGGGLGDNGTNGHERLLSTRNLGLDVARNNPPPRFEAAQFLCTQAQIRADQDRAGQLFTYSQHNCGPNRGSVNTVSMKVLFFMNPQPDS